MAISAFFALITVLGALGAVLLRNLVHCALSLAVAFAGLAVLYLRLNAQFAGFAQVLVYIGAVTVLILFVALLTRGGEPVTGSLFAPGFIFGIAVSTIVFAVIGGALLSSSLTAAESMNAPAVSVSQIAERLMTTYALPLQVVGLLLTAALIGAALIAMRQPPGEARQSPAPRGRIPGTK